MQLTMFRWLEICNVYYVKTTWWNYTTRGLTLHNWHQRQLQRMTRKCSCTHHIVLTLPPQTTTYWSLEGSQERPAIMMLFRKSSVAGCEVLKWISIMVGSFKLKQYQQKWAYHAGDFVLKKKSDWTCPSISDNIYFLSCTFVSVYTKCVHDFWYNLHIYIYACQGTQCNTCT